jgi:glyceraldehyde 3-phosphate dehydrogenase
MAIRVAINGFGRIGRNILRAALKDKDIDFVAINDITSAPVLAHLLKFDSIFGMLDADIEAKEDAIVVGGREIKVTAERDPAKLPWKEFKVDVVLECTGLFTQCEKALCHVRAGAKKVNCLAPVAKVLHQSFGIKKGLMTTIHAYTNDQKILDLPHTDLRRARAAALSMIPTTTGAAKAVGLVLPELQGKLDGMAVRVPVPNVSLVDLVAELEKDVTKEEVNTALKKAAEGELKGILEYCDEECVSIDFKSNPHSSILDASLTKILGGNMVKILSWYDNEWGFSMRMRDLVHLVAEKGL